jgi:hypothetical protein
MEPYFPEASNISLFELHFSFEPETIFEKVEYFSFELERFSFEYATIFSLLMFQRQIDYEAIRV